MKRFVESLDQRKEAAERFEDKKIDYSK